MRTLLSLIAAVGLVGCLGDIDGLIATDPASGDDGNDNGNNPAGGDLTAAKLAFDTNVYAVLAAKCGAAACHGEAGGGATLTRFVAANPANGWATAVNYTALVGNFTAAAAPVLTMVKNGTHYGITYTSDETAKIIDWLDKELAARAGQPNEQPGGTETLSQATERVLSAFAGCMQRSDFDAAQMAQRWGNMNAQNNQQCENCHSTGGEGFIATQNGSLFYQVISTKKYFFLQYFTVDLTQGAAGAKVMINDVSMQGVANGLAPHTEHPRFNYNNNNQGRQASNNFYNRTMTRVNTPGLCAPRPLEN